jgi:uncharacterized membrane protein YfcA
MRALLVSPIGFLIGLSMGALGSGGAIIAVPVLIYLAGQSPKEATASSLIIVASTAILGVVPHLRARRVNVKVGALLAIAGIPANVFGSMLNQDVDDDVLLLGFAMLMLAAAAAMARSWSKRRASNQPSRVTAPQPKTISVPSAASILKVLGAGSVVGLITGFFGIGGGFVIVPLLVLVFRFGIPEAAATSLMLIIINSVIALSSRLDGGYIDWSVIVPFGIASLTGVLLGGRLAGRVDPDRLQLAFVILIVALAAYTGGSAGIALATE